MAEISRQKRTRSRVRKKNSGRIQKTIIWSLVSLAFLIFAFAAFAYMKAEDFLDKIIVTPEEEPVVVGVEEDQDPKYTADPFAMVILGIDSRPQLGTLNTDVLIVAVVEPETKKVTMLSIPRDTAVFIPGYTGYHKVNAVYAEGELARRQAERNNQPITKTGTSLLKQTLEGLLGIPVKHFVTIDFEGFTKVIDELDGIEVDVERNLVYHDPTDGTAINLKKGLQTLSGKEALDYVRHRQDDRGSNYFSSDFDRNRRQQLVITKIVDRMKTFSGVTKIFAIMDAASNHIKTDLTREKIKGLALDFHSIGSENLITLETGAYWESRILKTVIPTEKLEEIRHTLWGIMGISEEQAKAKLLKENDLAVIMKTELPKYTVKETPKPDSQKNEQASNNADPNSEIVDQGNTISKTEEQNATYPGKGVENPEPAPESPENNEVP